MDSPLLSVDVPGSPGSTSSVKASSLACHWAACSFQGATAREFVLHVNQEHVSGSSSTWASANRGPDGVRCAWEGCMSSRTFSFPTRLMEHVRSHTQERPFACPVRGCNLRFTHRSNCVAHGKACHSRAYKPLVINIFQEPDLFDANPQSEFEEEEEEYGEDDDDEDSADSAKDGEPSVRATATGRRGGYRGRGGGRGKRKRGGGAALIRTAKRRQVRASPEAKLVPQTKEQHIQKEIKFFQDNKKKINRYLGFLNSVVLELAEMKHRYHTQWPDNSGVPPSSTSSGLQSPRGTPPRSGPEGAPPAAAPALLASNGRIASLSPAPGTPPPRSPSVAASPRVGPRGTPTPGTPVPAAPASPAPKETIIREFDASHGALTANVAVLADRICGMVDKINDRVLPSLKDLLARERARADDPAAAPASAPASEAPDSPAPSAGAPPADAEASDAAPAEPREGGPPNGDVATADKGADSSAPPSSP